VYFANALVVTVEPFEGSQVDGGGNTIPAYGAPYTLAGCAVAPTESWEPQDGSQQRVTTTAQLFAPYGTLLGPRDRVTTHLGVFEVEGDPEHWHSPFTGWRPGTTFRLRRVTG